MPLDKITERILEDAREAAAKILEKGKDDAEKAMAQYEKRAQEHEARAMKEAEAQAEAKRAQMINTAQRLARNEILARKQEWINRVFGEVRKDILGMPETEYIAFLTAILKKAGLEGTEEIGLSKKDLALAEKLAESLKKDFPDSRFSFVESPFPVEAGVVIKKGQTYLNASVDAILEELREKEGREVARLLFPEGGDGA